MDYSADITSLSLDSPPSFIGNTWISDNNDRYRCTRWMYLRICDYERAIISYIGYCQPNISKLHSVFHSAGD